MQGIRCILLLLLSAIIMFVGRGVDIVRCAHSGTVKVMTCLQGEAAHDDWEHLPDCGCMSVGHVEVSPMVLQPTVDFQPLLALAAVLPALLIVVLPILESKRSLQVLYVVRQSPPRSYLRFLCTLLI